MQCIDQFRIELKQRLPACANHHAIVVTRLRPSPRYRFGKLGRTPEVTATYTIGAHEIGVAELADRSMPVTLSPSPEVATRESAEYCRPTGVSAFSLQGVENFFNYVGHHAT